MTVQLHALSLILCHIMRVGNYPTPEPRERGVLCWSQPINNQCCGQSGPRGSYNRMPFSNNHQETEKNFLLLFITYRMWKLESIPGAIVR